jgi:hypothetical protein
LDPYSEGKAGQTLLLELEYTWVNIGEKRPDSTTITAINYTVKGEDLVGDNLLISLGRLEKPDATISSMLDCRFSRITFDHTWDKDFWTPAGLSNDTFMGDMIFKEFDFHYQVDMPGSRGIYTKETADRSNRTND